MTKFKCGNCDSTNLNVYHSDGGCDSCGYGSSTEITCNDCGAEEKYE